MQDASRPQRTSTVHISRPLPTTGARAPTRCDYDGCMSVEQTHKAAQILLEERARRPRWRRAVRKTAPSWFRGQELDLLDPAERDTLYRDISSRTQSGGSTLVIVAAANLPNMLRGFQSEGARRLLWTSLAIGYALILAGAWLYRRNRILVAGRREVRESADWPLRLLKRA